MCSLSIESSGSVQAQSLFEPSDEALQKETEIEKSQKWSTDNITRLSEWEGLQKGKVFGSRSVPHAQEPISF